MLFPPILANSIRNFVLDIDIQSIMAPKIAIVFYSMYGHIKQLALAEKKGIEAAGGTCDLYQYVVSQSFFPTEC